MTQYPPPPQMPQAPQAPPPMPAAPPAVSAPSIEPTGPGLPMVLLYGLAGAVVLLVLGVGLVWVLWPTPPARQVRDLLDDGEFDQAYQLCQDELADDAHNAELYLLLARMQTEKGMYRQAEDNLNNSGGGYYYRSGYRDGYDSTESILVQAMLANRSVHSRQAAELLESVLSSDSGHALANRELALAWLMEGRLDRARRAIDRSLKSDDSDAVAHGVRGLIHNRLGNHARARVDLQQALAGEIRDPKFRTVFRQVLGDPSLSGVDLLGREFERRYYD